MRLFTLAALALLCAPDDGDPKGGGAPPPTPPGATPPATPPKKDEAPPPPPPPAASLARLSEDDDDVPDGERFEISQNALRKRIARASSKQLRERFGTDNVDEIQTRIKRAEELEKAEEERRRAALSAEEKLKEDHAREKKRADDLEQQLAHVNWQRETDSVNAQTVDVARRYVKDKPVCMRAARIELKAHIREMSDAEAAVFGETEMDAWFKKWVEENPEFAKGAPAPPPAETPPPAHQGARVSLGAGATAPPAAPPLSGGLGPKTAKLGQPNSYSDEEWARERKRMGFNY